MDGISRVFGVLPNHFDRLFLLSMCNRSVRGFQVLLAACLLALGSAQCAEIDLEGVQTQIRSGELSVALESIGDLMEREPRSRELRMLRALVLGRLGRNDEAVEDYLALRKEFPEDPVISNNLASAYAALGRLEEASDAYRHALSLKPGYAVAHENLANIYGVLAAWHFKQALDIEPSPQRREKLNGLLSWAGGVGELGDLGFEAVGNTGPPTGQSTESGPSPIKSQAIELCAEVGPIGNAERVESVQDWLKSHGVEASVREVKQGYEVFWVYRGPFKSVESAKGEVIRLRKLGVADVGLIRSGELTNAVSLGVYRQLDYLKDRQSQLESKGVRSKVFTRRHDRSVAWLDLRGAELPLDELRSWAQDIKVHAGTCSSGTTS